MYSMYLLSWQVSQQSPARKELVTTCILVWAERSGTFIPWGASGNLFIYYLFFPTRTRWRLPDQKKKLDSNFGWLALSCWSVGCWTSFAVRVSCVQAQYSRLSARKASVAKCLAGTPAGISPCGGLLGKEARVLYTSLAWMDRTPPGLRELKALCQGAPWCSVHSCQGRV